MCVFMGKMHFWTLWAAFVMASSAGLTSCDSEDDNNDVDNNNTSDVQKKLLGITHSSNGWESSSPFSYSFLYENGKMTSHNTSVYTTTFSYEGNNIIKSQIIVDSTKTVAVDNTYYLNDDGTVNKRVCITPGQEGELVEEFVYNSDKQITERIQNGSVYHYHYGEMGVLSSISYEDREPGEFYTYTNDKVKTPIKNKAHLNFTTLLDSYSLPDIYGNTYAYLPVSYYTEHMMFELGNFIDDILFDWTIDGDGYPVAMKQTNKNAVEEYRYDNYDFNWKK